MKHDEPDGMGSWWHGVETDPVHGEAAAWLFHLSGPKDQVSAKDISDFRQWRDRDPRHAEAFVRLVAVSYKASRTSARRELDVRRLAGDDYDGEEPLSKWRVVQQQRRALYAIAASIIVSIGVAMLIIAMGESRPVPMQANTAEDVIETPIGENRIVSLADGSVLTLGGRTKIGTALSEQERTVRLYSGEAYFEVAKDRARRFVVHAGAITVTAVGTAFNVNQADELSVVTVVEGRVLVAPDPDVHVTSRQRSVHLDAGEQSTVDKGLIGDAIMISDMAPILSWQSGQLSFRNRPLRDAIQDVNRYTPKQLVLGTSSAGDIAVTGTVSSKNIDGWIRSLERAFDLTATEGPDRITLESANAERR